MKKFYIIQLAMVIMINSAVVNGGFMKNSLMITRAKAIELANKEAQKIGYSIELLDSRIEPTTIDRNGFLKNHREYRYYKSIMEKLDNHYFWVIYFFPKPSDTIILGGDLWVFIDAENGETLSVIRGK